MHARVISCCHSQAGQSLTELLVVAFALVPLFLLIPMIAKYQDIAHTTQVASRYAAFDATVNNDQTNGFKPAEQLAQEVRRRFFSNPDAAIKTNDAAGDFKAHQNLFWRDPVDNPLIERMDDVAVRRQSTTTTGAKAAFTQASLFSLQDSPMQRGEVEVPLVNLPPGIRSYEPFDNINLRVTRQTTVWVSDWAGRTPKEVNQKVRHSQGGVVMDGVDMLSSVMQLPFFLLELNKVKPPKIGDLDIWTDVVPEDRLRVEGAQP